MKSDNLKNYRVVCPNCGTYLIISIKVSDDEFATTNNKATSPDKESAPTNKTTDRVVCLCPRCSHSFTVELTALEEERTVYRGG
jgi:hypothetical protein